MLPAPITSETDYRAFISQIDLAFRDAAGWAKNPPSWVCPAEVIHDFSSTSSERILVVAPHPDDEVLFGGYALRRQKESGAEVWVAPYSLGSKTEKQESRSIELNRALARLGFQRVSKTVSNADDLVPCLERLGITTVVSCGKDDGHPTHRRSHAMVDAALGRLSPDRKSGVIRWLQCNFWGDLSDPNYLIHLPVEVVTDLGLALMEHQGEVSRNPFHLRLPAWFQDQVRRGSEQVLPVGAAAIPIVFGQIYKNQQWSLEHRAWVDAPKMIWL